jgi:hypothetical protein
MMLWVGKYGSRCRTGIICACVVHTRLPLCRKQQKAAEEVVVIVLWLPGCCFHPKACAQVTVELLHPVVKALPAATFG